MLIKVYGANPDGEQRYQPSGVVETATKIMIGNPDPSRICTSIVERSNLSMRTSIRRLTRLTNAFSKKWDHLKAMLAVYFAYYNFCRIHSSIRCTPAMESGITQHVWTLRDLLTAYFERTIPGQLNKFRARWCHQRESLTEPRAIDITTAIAQ